jgi:transcriptional regulator with XRE-family HTH domain
MKPFGELLKFYRLRNKMSLRTFWKEVGKHFDLSPSEISLIERGICPPVQGRERLLRLAVTLGLSDYELLDFLAAALFPGDEVADVARENLAAMEKYCTEKVGGSNDDAAS